MASTPVLNKYDQEDFTDSDIHGESYKPGLSRDQVCDLYNRWYDYNSYSNLESCRGPTYAAETVKKYFENNKDCSIVDLGAGTGQVGIELRKRGFTRLSAIEGSSGMLKNVPGNLYTKIHQFYIGDNVTDIPSDEFDCCASSGVFIPNHIPVEGLNEIIRIIKPGGIFTTIIREKYLADEFYADKLEPRMLELEKKGYWSKLERTIVPKYFQNDNGVIFAYRVLKSGF